MSRRKGSKNYDAGGRHYLSIGPTDEGWRAEHPESGRKGNGHLCACCGAKIRTAGLIANGAIYCGKTCFLMMAAH